MKQLIFAFSFFLYIFIPAFAFQLHNPINIDNDTNFSKENGVKSGNGTETSPYIIEGWGIELSNENDSGIFISNTTKYFVIKNCYILNTNKSRKNYNGIYLKNVKNCKIDNVTIGKVETGINNWYGTIDEIFNYSIYDSNCSIYNLHGNIGFIKNCKIVKCNIGINNWYGTIKNMKNCIMYNCNKAITAIWETVAHKKITCQTFYYYSYIMPEESLKTTVTKCETHDLDKPE